MRQEISKCEIIRIADCPSWKSAKENFESALTKLGFTQTVQVSCISSEIEAKGVSFSGSPMLLINGNDLFPLKQYEFHLNCRVFAIDDHLVGFPPTKVIMEKIANLISN